MWYVIQTMTGREQELTNTIGKVIDHRICERCFFLKREAVWRIQGQCRVHEELLFPGYVFVVTQKPQELYRQLKEVPSFAKLLGKDDLDIHPVSKEEEIFLKRMLNGDPSDTVRLSQVTVDDQGEILSCGGALRYFSGYIIKKRIRLRYVVIRVFLLGREREVMLGIRLDGDEEKS